MKKYGFKEGLIFDDNYVVSYFKHIRDDWANSMVINIRYGGRIEFQLGGIPHCYLDDTLYNMMKDGIITIGTDKEIRKAYRSE